MVTSRRNPRSRIWAAWVMLAACLASSSAHGVDYTETFQTLSGYTADWCRDGSDLRFRLSAVNDGWLSIGFNLGAQMPGTDAIMVTGEGAIVDAFAGRRAPPTPDALQNVELHTFSQVDGRTTVEFSRPILSPDGEDLALDSDVYLVWAMNSFSDSFQEYHTDRGTSPSMVNFSLAASCGGLGLAGDLNDDGRLDVLDIDRLQLAVRESSTEPKFDRNGDSQVDSADVMAYLRDTLRSFIGDANLDGQFTSGDLVQVFAVGEYEDGLVGNSSWSDGDWDADAEFSTADLVFAFQDGGFEAGPRPALAQVPEPASSGILWMSLLFCTRWRRSVSLSA